MRAKAIQWAKYILICDGDEWSFKDETLTHDAKGTPALDCSNVAFVSAMVILPSGVRVYEQPWSRERILAHRNKYAKGLQNPGSPWNKDPQAMWGKVALKSLMRFAPLSPELREAFNEGDGGEVFGGFELGAGDPTAALRAGASVLALGAGETAASDDAAPVTLADAEAFTLPGGPKAWGGKGGSAFGALSTRGLQRFIKWVDDDAEKGVKFAHHRIAAEMVLADKGDAAASAELGDDAGEDVAVAA
jgi:hypothetical protein